MIFGFGIASALARSRHGDYVTGYYQCMRQTCSVGFPAWTLGGLHVDPLTGQRLPRDTEPSCSCVLYAAEDPK